MKTITVEDFKTSFAAIIEATKNGKGFKIIEDESHEIVGYFVANGNRKIMKRKLGILKNKVKVVFKDDFKMTVEEFITL